MLPTSTHLAAPPRHVPLSLKVMNYCNGLAQGGWFFFGVGMIFFWIFSTNSDLSFLTFRGPHQTAVGKVTSVEETGASENKVRVRANHYQYSVAGRTFAGVSYVTGIAPNPGDTVTVEYDAARPERSRIAGMRRALFGPAAAFVNIFPVVGLLLVFAAVRVGAKRNRLLRDGILTTGTLTNKAGTSMRINKQPVYELTFAFTTRDGRRCEMKTRTHETARLEDEVQEPLLYDPHDPQVAYVLDEAPARPRFELTGELRGHGLGAIRWLLLPALVLLAHGTVAAVKLGLWQW